MSPSPSLAFLGFAGISAVAFGFLGPELGRIATALENEGPSPAIFARLGTRINVARLLSGLLLVILFVMVVKPGN
jgi:hypothetical protein